MRMLIAVFCATLAAPGAYASGAISKTMIHIVATEPPPGTLGRNKAAYVDDGTCPAGQIKMVIGAPDMHTPRQKSCVPR